MKKTFIIITSIFEPTLALKKYSKFKNYQLVIVGDKKTPKKWKLKNAIYLSPEQQEKMDYEIIKLLPWNHYCRKMIGYLYAIENNAEIIVDTDDDNIPLKNWSFPNEKDSLETYPKDSGFVNVYNDFTDMNIWPRGFPLDKIKNSRQITDSLLKENKSNNVMIWQGLANNDPDVDAIYRLINNTPCFFRKREPIVLESGTVCPFNSQNTFFKKEVFALLYLPAFVTFRTTDILRSIVAQPILWNFGYSLGFTEATVIQERNPHDYIKDFESEIPLYLNSEKIYNLAYNNSKKQDSIANNLLKIYTELHKEKIVSNEELKLLNAWIKDLKKIKFL